jgi:hypothetical protein
LTRSSDRVTGHMGWLGLTRVNPKKNIYNSLAHSVHHEHLHQHMNCTHNQTPYEEPRNFQNQHTYNPCSVYFYLGDYHQLFHWLRDVKKLQSMFINISSELFWKNTRIIIQSRHRQQKQEYKSKDNKNSKITNLSFFLFCCSFLQL